MHSDMNVDQLKVSIDIVPEKTASALSDLIVEHEQRLERQGVILGLSGGLDSAVAAALCARAVGPEKTLALLMPDKDSCREHLRDALDYARKLGIRTRVIDITPVLRQLGVYRLFFLNRFPLPRKIREALARKAHAYYSGRTGRTPFESALFGARDESFDYYLKSCTAYYRAKHRLRMVLLYLRAERENRLVVGAANRTEYMVGFFVKHGIDDAADVMPLLGLYKTQVRRLARHLGVPERIVGKAPSPDLIPGITDELALGMGYETLDMVLLALDRGWKSPEIASALGVSEGEVARVKDLTVQSAHMRE